MSKKRRGEYYTPKILADFMMRRVLLSKENERELRILESSMGAGAFINALASCAELMHNKNVTFTGIEKNQAAFTKAEKLSKKTNTSTRFILEKDDFLDFQLTLNQSFSIAIGNPPYVKKSLLTKRQIDLCNDIHTKAGLASSRIKNIWTAFLIRCVQALAEDGVLAFVLPSELLQVSFAKEIRGYLLKHCARLEIFTFDDLLFECKGQDTVLLFCYKNAQIRGQFYCHIKEISALQTGAFTLTQNAAIEVTGTKWSHHLIDSDDLNFLHRVMTHLPSIGDVCSTVPGVVTAANDFFIVNQDKEVAHGLRAYTRPIIQKGSLVNGSIEFSCADFESLYNNNYPSKFLDLTGHAWETLPKCVRNYVAMGEAEGLNKRYKMRKRSAWYIVPNVVPPGDGFFFKRAHRYPKLIKNSADVLVTDAAYKIQLQNEWTINDLIYSFYNSLTLAFAELNGRYYGGGVLELTPKEFKSLPVSLSTIAEDSFQRYTQRFEQKKVIEEITEQNDPFILGRIGLTLAEIERIQVIYKKLVDKRFRKP